ncbi:MAG: HD-GYP domain-containing protein [Atribacterota bacterium]|nr:HD-GYP domain-containing protein [Atribacterota bacterium]MDD5637525.1 HD-GYP domain-containing protein [Atribacterota bacterium]
MNSKLKIFISVVFLSAILLFILLLPTMPVISEIWLHLLFFTVVAVLAEYLPVVLPTGGKISVSFPISFVVILVYGPAAAMVFEVLSIIWTIFNKKELWYKSIFNATQYSLSAGLAGLIYLFAGGMIGKQNFINYLLPAALCALTFCFINLFLVTCVISLDSGMNIIKVYRINIKDIIPSYLAEAPMGFIMAIIYVQIGILGILLFFFPLFLARQSFELYTRMRKMYLDTIRTLAATIDAKDPYTHGHSERVSLTAVQLAKKLDFVEPEIEYLEYAAILHDIGKIGIEDRILGKKDKLTEEEYEKIKEHPVIGASIVESIEFLKKSSKAVLYHHERYDGKGYPHGLKGEEIPKAARLLAVVDAYDAMNSDRPYRKKLSENDILNELEREAGKQFDPIMVKLFISLLKEKRAD